MLRLCGFFFLMMLKQIESASCTFFLCFLHTRESRSSDELGKAAGNHWSIMEHSSSSLSSCVPQQQTASFPRARWGCPIPGLSAAAGSLASSVAFVSHQLLLILGVSISSHPHTTFHRRSITSLNYSHTPGYLWIIFTLKEGKNVSLDHCNASAAWEEPFLQGSLIWITWAEHQPLQVPFPCTQKAGHGLMVVISRYLGAFSS